MTVASLHSCGIVQRSKEMLKKLLLLLLLFIFILPHQIYRQGCLLAGQGPVPRNDEEIAWMANDED